MGFWSTTSGLATGVAGTLTGVVGIAALAAQMGWIGSDGDGQEAASSSGRAGAEVAEDTDNRLSEPAGARADRSGDAAEGDAGEAAPSFAVAPASVRFAALGSPTATVSVRNTGTAEVRVEDVTVDGDDEERFTVAAAPCTASTLDPGRSCEVEVSYAAEGGTARATLVVEVDGAPAQEVPLTGAGLL